MANINLTSPVFYKNGTSGVSAVVGYESLSNRVVRYTLHTGATGASGVRLAFSGNWQGNGTQPSLRFYIGTDPDSHANAGAGSEYTGTLTASGYDYSGSAEVMLLPEMDYYVWVFPADTTFGWLYWSRSEGSAVVSCTGGALTLLTAGPGTLGQPMTLSLNRYADFSHTVTVRLGSQTLTVCENSTETSLSWTPPLELAWELPNAAVGVAVFTVTSLKEGQALGSTQTNLTLSVPESLAPTVSAVWRDAGGAFDTFGTCVQLVSRLTVEADALGSCGSTIVSTALTLNGQPYAGGVLLAAGEQTLTVTVTDSRGRTGSDTHVLSVAEYAVPWVRIDASRCDEDGTANDMGEYALVTITGKTVQVAQKNTASLTFAWGDSAETVALEVGGFTLTRTVPADSTRTLALWAELADSLTASPRASMVLSIGYATLDFLGGGRGIAFGTTATKEGFTCAMDTDFSGRRVTGLPEPREDSDAVPRRSVVTHAWITPTAETTLGVLVYGSSAVIENTQTNGRLVRVEVTGLEKLLVKNARQWSVDYGYYLVSFTDVAGVILDRYAAESSGTVAEVELSVPDGAVYAYINGHKDNEISVSAYKRYDVAVLAEEKANRITDWLTLSGTLKSKYLVYGSSGTNEASNNNGEILTCDVRGLKKVRVKGFQYSIPYNYAACYFYDAAGAYIEKHFGDASSTTYVAELDVPENAVTLKVNGHIYDGRAEVVGYRVFDVADLYDELRPRDKKLITLGDSITALGTGATGWVKYFLEKTRCRLVANVAVNGAWLHDKDGTVYDGNPVFDGEDANVNNVLGNQVQKIINNAYEAPDIILIAIGTNAGISITKDQIKAAYYDSAGSLIPLETVDRTTSAGAYRWCLEKLHAAYPNAQIFWCTPIHACQSARSAENVVAWGESLRIATAFTGQQLIDTARCGINGANEIRDAEGEDLADGLHPNASGAKKIGCYNAAVVQPFLNNSFAEV